MSIWLQVTVTSEQRTSFGTGGERAYLTHTHPFLPGSVLRGALAAAWLKDAASDADFELIFERGRFGPALPQGVDVEPQSVGKCKYHRDPSHAEYIDFAFEADPEAAKKAKCAARENLKGNFTRKNLVTRAATAIEPRKNTAAQSQLFSREMIEKGTTFVGHVVLPDKAADARLAQLERAFFGGRGSILGRCRVSWKQIQTLPGTEQLKAAQRVVIRTLSPTILVDDAGLPSTDLRAAIKEIAGTDPSSVWADRVESGLAGGWHSASGMPKPSEIAIAPGAVAVLDSVDPDQVRRLLDHGLGVRRNEGYGWVEVVPEAWQPPAVTPPTATPVLAPLAARTDRAAEWLAKVNALALNDTQKQWFANQLRRIPAGSEESVRAAMDIAGQGSLTQVQLEGSTERSLTGVVALLAGIPKGIRQSVASELTKGVRQ